MKASQIVKVRGVKDTVNFKVCPLRPITKWYWYRVNWSNAFAHFCKESTAAYPPPTNERPRTSGVFRSIFFRLCAYAGLRFRCTTPPESSIRQCHRHTPLLQRFGEHTPLLTLHYYYTQPKGICQLGSFFFETEVVARYSSLRPEFTTKMKWPDVVRVTERRIWFCYFYYDVTCRKTQQNLCKSDFF